MQTLLKIYQLFLFAGLTIILISCERVIDVSIDNVEKKYVIEGQITDNANSVRVNISQTIDITDSNKFVGVETAEVTLSENGNPAVKLVHAGGGIYRANMTGVRGRTYTLTIKTGGKTFTSASVMPAKAEFDTLYVTERMFLGKMRKLATVEFTDPLGTGNAYRFVQYIDGQKENTIFVIDDKLVDGRKVIYELLIFGDQDYTLKTDDQLRVEMRCIDMPGYQFWYSLTQSSLGQSQSASPGNPITNIKGGALGYFSAQTFQARNIAVK